MAKTVVLGVGGGIAAYKSAALCSLLVKSGFRVEVLMTEHATRFIQPVTFQALSKNPVVVDTFHEPDPSQIAHIAIADRADVFVIAPATANLLAKLALGIADDMVSTTALAVTAPVIVAPAMNVHMYNHPAVQANLSLLRQRGVIVVDPGSGLLACGYTGKGRLAEPEDIADVIQAVIEPKKELSGVKVVVTAGPTIEDIDPVRFLSNSSTGKMGYALAAAAVASGAEVTLISGPTSLAPIPGTRVVRVRSTEDMLQAALKEMEEADVFISAAAPADFRPAVRLQHKWKKSTGVPQLELETTPDILATVAGRRQPGQVFVGFAAETQKLLESARKKLAAKNLDMVVANDVSQEDAGFAVDTNRAVIVDRTGQEEALPLMEKSKLAAHILQRVAEFYRVQNENLASEHLGSENRGSEN